MCVASGCAAFNAIHDEPPPDAGATTDAGAPARLETGPHLRLAFGDLDGDARSDEANLRSLQPSDVAHLFLTKP